MYNVSDIKKDQHFRVSGYGLGNGFLLVPGTGLKKWIQIVSSYEFGLK